MTDRRQDRDPGSLRSLFEAGAGGTSTDGQLLERFATGAGPVAERAFAALIERHGPLVQQTCRSILRDDHAAQDACQATFLVLVRQAGSLWVDDSLGPWLHRVACRIARAQRGAAARRTARERAAARVIGSRGDPAEAAAVASIRAAIHEEIERLPERQRVPIVLCDLESRTHEEAARLLGCPVGTVKSRLSRGRERLRSRLERRGLACPAAPLADLPPRAAWGSTWSAATTSAAVQIAAGRSVAGVVPAAVSVLVSCGSKELLMVKLRGVALALVTVGSLGGIGVAAWAGFGGPSGHQEPTPRPPTPPAAAGPESPGESDPREVVDLRGRWEVIYLAGTVAGERQGFPTPGIVVPVTAETINLPSLTGKADDPINYLGAMPYALRPGRPPGAIDLQAGPAGGTGRRGIYQLAGSILTICWGDADRGRPAAFVAGEAGETLIILRRAGDRPGPTPGPGPVIPTRPRDPAAG